MKIEKSIMVTIRQGSTIFATEGGFWTNDLSKVIPELRSTRTEFEINISFEIQRQEGWYWVKLKRWTSFLPCFYDASVEAWFFAGSRISDSDMLDININETRIPEPTDG